MLNYAEELRDRRSALTRYSIKPYRSPSIPVPPSGPMNLTARGSDPIAFRAAAFARFGVALPHLPWRNCRPAPAAPLGGAAPVAAGPAHGPWSMDLRNLLLHHPCPGDPVYGNIRVRSTPRPGRHGVDGPGDRDHRLSGQAILNLIPKGEKLPAGRTAYGHAPQVPLVSIATYTDMGPDTTAYHIFHFKLTCFSPALRSLTRSPASIRSDQVPGQVRHGHRCSPHHQTRFESTCALPRRPGCAHSAHGRNRVR